MAYKIKKSRDGDIIPCDCCGCEVALDDFTGTGKHKELCEVCSTTFIGSILSNRSEAVTKEELAQVANLLIAKIKKEKQ